jgi:hypothetical protein
MMASVYGKAATGALLQSFRQVLHGGAVWPSLWKCDRALSFLPGKH